MEWRNNVLSSLEAKKAVESLRKKSPSPYWLMGVRYCFDRATIAVRFGSPGEIEDLKIHFDRDSIEMLNVHREPLICEFAREIIMAFDNPEIYPTWFISECISELSEMECEEITQQKRALESECQKAESIYRELEQLIPEYKTLLAHQERQHESTANEYIATKNELKRFKFNPISFFKKIDLLLTFKDAAKWHKIKAEQYAKELAEFEAAFPEAERQYHLAVLKNTPIIESLDTAIEKEHHRCVKRLEEVNAVPPLTNGDYEGRIFIPVKFLQEMDHSFLPGCYIVRNRYNGKCYIGHSKDPVARLRQVFKGLKPRISTLLNDYYMASENKRQAMFEFCIIPASDDQVRLLEAQLMEEHHSKTEGYNKKL
jgi:hypothetical protein